MVDPSEIRRRIEEALPGARITVTDLTGGKDHYEVEVVAEQFAGMNALARHRKVYGLFDDVIGGPLHALSLTLRAQGE